MSNDKIVFHAAADIIKIWMDYRAELTEVFLAVTTLAVNGPVIRPKNLSEPLECLRCGKKFDLFEVKCPKCYRRLKKKLEEAEQKIKHYKSKEENHEEEHNF